MPIALREPGCVVGIAKYGASLVISVRHSVATAISFTLDGDLERVYTVSDLMVDRRCTMLWRRERGKSE